MKRIILLIVLLFTFGTGSIFAQENPQEMAKKYNIQFPIAELGNCADISSCKAYCDSESNRDTCMSFAKKKGFHKEIKRSDDAMMQSAKETLGCDSESTCRSICEKEENFEKCSSFAQKYGLGGPPPGKSGEILQKAKEILGCDSEQSCRSICENPDNQQKCSDFAQKTGLGGGIKRVGPGGCNSQESCMEYCKSHPNECEDFGSGGPRERKDGQFNMDKEDFCRQNPDKCRPPEDMKSQYDSSTQRPENMQYQQPPEQYQNEGFKQEEQKTMTYPEAGSFNQQSPQRTETQKSF